MKEKATAKQRYPDKRTDPMALVESPTPTPTRSRTLTRVTAAPRQAGDRDLDLHPTRDPGVQIATLALVPRSTLNF